MIKMAELIRGEVLRRANMQEEIRKALRSKGFAGGPFAYTPPERPGPVGDLSGLKDLLRKARDDERTATAEYSGLASMAERLGVTETGRKLRLIALDEMEHYKTLEEILEGS